LAPPFFFAGMLEITPFGPYMDKVSRSDQHLG
jgi:hypothetical protein